MEQFLEASPFKKEAKGDESFILIVYLLIDSMFDMGAIYERPGEVVSGSSILSKLNFTSSAVSSLPL